MLRRAIGRFSDKQVSLLRDFAADRNRRSHVWYRWFNEVPVVFLFAAVALVVVKPF